MPNLQRNKFFQKNIELTVQGLPLKDGWMPFTTGNIFKLDQNKSTKKRNSSAPWSFF